MSKKKGKAGRTRPGNVTLDLGETLERRLAGGGMAGGKNYRPGMGAPWRPPWAQEGQTLGAKLGLSRNVNLGRAMGGAALGALGNRVLRRVTPGIIGSNSELLVDGLNAFAGIVPLFFKRNDVTYGIAIPGVLQVAFDLADAGLDMIGVAKPALEGSRGPVRVAGNPAGRQRLIDMRNRLRPQVAGAQPFAGGQRPLRVVAQ